jgi:hypothetical protein
VERSEAELAGRPLPAEHSANALPDSLTRRYDVLVRPRTTMRQSKLREIGAAQIGHLVTFKASSGSRGGRGRQLLRAAAALLWGGRGWQLLRAAAATGGSCYGWQLRHP